MPLLRSRSRFSLQSLVRSLFSRSMRMRGMHRSQRPQRPAVRRGSVLGEGACGFDSLESRAMLAADDIGVSLVSNQLVLTLDAAGATISNLSTAYSASTGVLTVTAKSAGTITSATPITGIKIDTQADTIAVDLKILPKFAGLSVVGGSGAGFDQDRRQWREPRVRFSWCGEPGLQHRHGQRRIGLDRDRQPRVDEGRGRGESQDHRRDGHQVVQRRFGGHPARGCRDDAQSHRPTTAS